MIDKLLGRKEWNQAVLSRDSHACVLCKAANAELDVHHIMERKLFANGGYFLNNGVSLCARPKKGQQFSCHMQAEGCMVLPSELRKKAGINRVVLPTDLNPEEEYDKWGNTIICADSRKPGKIFENEEVQKVLKRCNTLWMYFG